MKNEAQAQTYIGKWIRENWEDTAVFELKLVKLLKRKALPFSDVKPHQVDNLLRAKHKGLYHKIQDSPVSWGSEKMRFTMLKPFDCLFVKSPAYVMVCFYEPWELKEFIIIDIDVWEKEKKTSQRKSLTLDRARKIGRTLNI